MHWLVITVSVVLIAYAVLLSVSLVLLWLRPLWLFQINETLARTAKVNLPEKWGGQKVSPRFLLTFGFFHFSPRVLDAWVTKHRDIARRTFAEDGIVQARQIYVPLPVLVDETLALGDFETSVDVALKSSGPDPVTKALQPRFRHSVTCLLIPGEGGLGKTSLACALGKAAMDSNEEQRLHREHAMLPVLIGQDLETRAAEGDGEFLRLVGSHLRVLVDEQNQFSTEFVKNMLKRRRILLIVDGFSELSSGSQREFLIALTRVPVNACIVTSRAIETLDGMRKTVVRPSRIIGNQLYTFVDKYLTARGKRDLFVYDSEFRAICDSLNSIVGDREITPLLVKLYVEQVIAVKEGNSTGDLPEDVPDLMLSYLNEINRVTGPRNFDDRKVHRAAKIIAWECLKQTYRPTAAQREDVLAALGSESQALPILKYLEETLKIIQTVGPGRDRIRFTLDPLSEYLAAMHLISSYGAGTEAWRGFIDTAKKNGSPDSMKGFLLAVRECCIKAGHGVVPEFVAEEVATLLASDVEQKRVAESINLLRSLFGPIRLEAIKALGGLGEAAGAAVPHLIDLLADKSEDVRMATISSLVEIGSSVVPALIESLTIKSKDVLIRRGAVKVLKRLGINAVEAVQVLVEALDDPDKDIRDEAINALGSIGPSAKLAVPALLDVLEKTDINFTGSDTAHALQMIISESHILREYFSILTETLRRAKATARQRIIDILGEFPEEGEMIAPILIECLEDTDQHVRSMATYTLVSFRGFAVPNLITALDSSNSEVRNRAALILAEIGPASKDAVSALIDHLSEKEERVVRLNAIRALGKIGPEAKAAVSLLIELEKSEDADFRRAAGVALGRIRT